MKIFFDFFESGALSRDPDALKPASSMIDACDDLPEGLELHFC